MTAQIISLLIKALSVSTLLTLGLDTKIGELSKELRSRGIWKSLFLSSLALPIFCWFLLWILGRQNEPDSLGLLIAVACAGGSSAGIFIKLIRGNETFAGSLVVLQALSSSLLAPLVFGFQLMGKDDSVLHVVSPLILMTIYYQLLPFGLGFWLSSRNFRLSLFSSVLSKFNTLGLIALVIGFFIGNYQYLTELNLPLWSALLACNLVAFFGDPVYRWFNIGSLGSTLSFTIGIRNLTMALFIAAVLNIPGQAQLPILVYGLIMYLFATARFFVSKKSDPCSRQD